MTWTQWGCFSYINKWKHTQIQLYYECPFSSVEKFPLRQSYPTSEWLGATGHSTTRCRDLTTPGHKLHCTVCPPSPFSVAGDLYCVSSALSLCMMFPGPLSAPCHRLPQPSRAYYATSQQEAEAWGGRWSPETLILANEEQWWVVPRAGAWLLQVNPSWAIYSPQTSWTALP